MSEQPVAPAVFEGPHPDDEFHPPTSDDPNWTETCWFTFAVPERRLSGQLYPFFSANQRTLAAGVILWDDHGDQLWNCRYYKNFWHLPWPEGPLSDLQLANGIRYRCTEGQRRFELGYDDPDGDEVHIELTFEAAGPPNYWRERHLDQPGRYRGTIVLHGERIEVDAYGFRDRSWGPRSQFGLGRPNGYTYATASPTHGFHLMTVDRGEGYLAVHGHLMRDGVWAPVASGRREILGRDPGTGCPTAVAIELEDENGRRLEATGQAHNRIGVHLNPNLFTWNCLTEWTFDGVRAWGEDHDNWTAAGIRQHARSLLYTESAG